MTSESGSASGTGGNIIAGRYPAWKYCTPVEGNRNGTTCNYCGLTIKSGGITRFKYHLSHTDPNSNTKKCPRVPPEVKQEIRELLNEKNKAKAKKAAIMEDIRAELRETVGGKRTHLIDEDDDDDDDVHMYPADMHPDEQVAYRAAVRASRASAWNREQEHAFVGSKRKTGEPSRPSDATRLMQRSQSVRFSNPTPPLAPSLYKSSAARQKSVKNLFKGGAIKETMGRLISKFFIYESVPPQKADSHHFKNMIVGAQQAGMGIEPPSPYEIKNKYLDMEYKDMEDYVNLQREKWKTYGCTIMCDGWTGPTKLSIINFMVYSKGSTVFLKSVDASNNIKDNKYIYGLLKAVIKEVGRENVVQIVTDNGSALVKAGKLLMKKYNLYWTPCAAHCIDLMFEDIGKRDSVADVIVKARKITNFIYNHGWLLALMRNMCGGDIVRPGATRFATNYIALDSLLKKRVDLKKVFISDEWSSHKLSRTVIGHEVEQLMFNHAYWEKVSKTVLIYEALYTVLRIVDSEVVPTMPFVYELIRVMKDNLVRLNARDWTLQIIKDRWDRTLKHPLHAAGN